MPLRKLLLAVSQYSLGSLFTALAGFVSFPFLTRIFSVSDYGIMNLISATLAVLVAVGKLGIQHAVVRFHSGAGTQEEKTPDRKCVVSTAVLGMALTGLIVGLAWCGFAELLPPAGLGDRRLRPLLMLIGFLITIQVLDSALVNLLRAEQRSATLTSYQVLKKYLGLSLMISSLLLVRRDLSVFYTAQVMAELTALLVLGWVVFRADSGLPRPSLRAFSAPLLTEMLRYGVPMMLGWEVAGIVLMLGDRYLVQGLLGPSRLGTYVAAYNLCQYVEAVLISPWGLAITPIYVRLFDKDGEEQARAFLNRTLRYYVLVGVPVVGGLSAIGPELLTFLASDKYREGAPVIPYVVAGLVAAGAVPITGAGVFIQRRTWVAARFVVLSAVLNLGLNALLIPAMGIEGAALATLVSYLVLLVGMTRAGARHLCVAMPWNAALRALAATLVMYATIASIHFGGRVVTLGTRIGLGLVIYGMLIVALDKTVRDDLRTFLGVGLPNRGQLL